MLTVVGYQQCPQFSLCGAYKFVKKIDEINIDKTTQSQTKSMLK